MSSSLYELLLNQHELKVQMGIDLEALLELRERASACIDHAESPIYLGNRLQSFQQIPVLGTNPELASPLGWPVVDGSETDITAECLKSNIDLICVATFERELKLGKSGRLFTIRFGYFSQEADILNTRIMGFDAITLHVDKLDLYQMQYVVEVCRDYKLSCILVVSNKQSLQIALETDCPNIAVWAYAKDTLEFLSSFANEAVRLMPKACVPFLFAPALQEAQIKSLAVLDYKAVFVGR